MRRVWAVWRQAPWTSTTHSSRPAASNTRSARTSSGTWASAAGPWHSCQRVASSCGAVVAVASVWRQCAAPNTALNRAFAPERAYARAALPLDDVKRAKDLAAVETMDNGSLLAGKRPPGENHRLKLIDIGTTG